MAAEISQVVMDSYAVTTIINNLNTLYSNAVSQLISYSAGVLALVGVAIPTITTLVQRRSLESERRSLEKTIFNEIEDAKKTIRESLNSELKELVEAEEKSLTSRMEGQFQKLERKIECAEAGTFFVQSNASLDTGKPHLAVDGYCIATRNFFRGDDDLNGQRALKRLIDDCLPKINKNQYVKFNIETSLKKLTSFLKENNKNGRHSDSIRAIDSAIKEIQTRDPEA